jgi:hypothetical protein
VHTWFLHLLINTPHCIAPPYWHDRAGYVHGIADSQAARSALVVRVLLVADAYGLSPIERRLDMPLFGPPNVEKLRAKGDIQGLIKALEWEKDERVPEMAVDALVSIGEPAVEPLIAAFNENYSVSEKAADALARIGDSRALEPLIAGLGDFLKAFASCSALGQLSDPRAREALIAALEHEVPLVRGKAAVVLGDVGDTKAIQPLITVARDDKNPPLVRNAALDAMFQIGDTSIVKTLYSISRLDSDATVREKAFQAAAVLEVRACTDELCQILEQEKDAATASESSKQRVIEIGKRLHKMNGFELMKHVCDDVAERHPSGYELINAWWHGIGEWRY